MMKLFGARFLNLDALFKTAILLGFTIFFTQTIITGEALAYVSPKIFPFIKFSAAIMALMAVFSAVDIVRIPRKRPRMTTYTLFALSLALALLFPPAFLGGSDLKGRQVDLGLYRTENGATRASGNLELGRAAEQQRPTGPGEPPPALQGNKIVFTEENFYYSLYLLYREVEYYQGIEVEISGFVFKDASFAADEFVVSRFVMVCCTADMQLAGIMCHFPGSQGLEENTWVRVKGVLQQGTFRGETIPVIIPVEISPINMPDPPYVYPKF